MKKSDLQLGDWCRIKGGEPFQVSATTLSLADDVFDKNVEPILLTADILQKLGFEEDKEHWSGFYKYTFEKNIKDDVKVPNSDIKFDGHIKMSIIYRIGDGMFEDFELDVYNRYGSFKLSNFTRYTALEGEPLYVHDLQHLLKITNSEIDVKL